MPPNKSVEHARSKACETSRRFTVETAQAGGKDFELEAPDDQSLRMWLNALRPHSEGPLHKMGQSRKSWKARTPRW